MCLALLVGEGGNEYDWTIVLGGTKYVVTSHFILYTYPCRTIWRQRNVWKQ